MTVKIYISRRLPDSEGATRSAGDGYYEYVAFADYHKLDRDYALLVSEHEATEAELAKAIGWRDTNLAGWEKAQGHVVALEAELERLRIALRDVQSCAEHCSPEGGVGCAHCARVVRSALERRDEHG